MEVAAWSQAVPEKERLGLRRRDGLIVNMDGHILLVAKMNG